MMNELLTVAEAADYFRVSERTVYNLVRSGELPAIKIGASWRIPLADLSRLSNRRPPQGGQIFGAS